MSEDLKRRVLLFQGPGFLEDGAMELPLKGMGYEVQKYQFLPLQKKATELDLGPKDTLILRGLSAASVEDVLYSKVLGRALSSLGEQISKMSVEQRPRVVATGRWALGSMFAGFWGADSATANVWGWRNISAEGSLASWVKSKTSSGDSFYVLKTSDLILDLQAASLPTLLETSAGTPLAWAFEGRVFLFALDPFSLIDGSQLPDYGYENQEDLLNGSDYLMNLLGAAKSEP